MDKKSFLGEEELEARLWSFGRNTAPLRLVVYAFLLLGAGMLAGCAAPAQQLFQFEGRTMGTSYHISFGSSDADLVDLANRDKHLVDSMLVALNLSMSTYIDSSMISVVNASRDTAIWHPVDSHFEAVFLRSRMIYEDTDGIFNPAIGPLVDAYGFGPVERGEAPDSAAVAALLRLVDFESFVLDLERSAVQKRNADARLDFSAIAKGYGVDMIARFFLDRGTSNFFVEIGGEIRTNGEHPSGRAWRTGIEQPSLNPYSDQEMQAIVELGDEAMATSGNYRNYYEQNGQKYVHIIDPRTGVSQPSSLLSVSVMAPDCMTADAYATALMVLGVEDGLAFVESSPLLEAYFISADDTGQFIETRSSGFPQGTSK